MGAGEIPVSGTDPDAVPPSSGTIPPWRASWESPVHCILCTGGNPRTGLVRAAASSRRRFPSFLKVLLGTGRLGVLRAWWAGDGGRSGCGSSSFRRFAFAFIYFPFWACLCCCPSIFLWFELLYRWWLLYLYSWAKACFVEIFGGHDVLGPPFAPSALEMRMDLARKSSSEEGVQLSKSCSKKTLHGPAQQMGPFRLRHGI